jgi:hypothetical protein
MKQCRMCSQRLTRPGRLCRECERELQRAHPAGLAIGELPTAVTSSETVRMTGGSEWLTRLRSPVAVVALAFAIGVAASVAMEMNERPDAGGAHRSVMLGAAVRQTSIVSPGAAAVVYAPAVPVAASATVEVTSATARSKIATRGATVARAAAPIATAAVVDASRVTDAAPASSQSESVPVLDDAGMLADALARCAEAPFLARPDCEERARARYCDATSPLPQCLPSTREYGQ